MSNEEAKRLGRPPKDDRLVQTAVRVPKDIMEFYRTFPNASDHMRRALEEYRDKHTTD